MISYNKTSLSIIATALLTACGGDSSNSSQPTTGPDPVEPPTSSTLSFRDSATRVFLTGQTILNPAISTAANEVTYRSSNSNVARVLGDGKIETLAPGSATIYADSANGSASWPIEVEQPHVISAWISDSGSDLFLDNLPNNSRVFSAASEQCIAVDNSSCGNWLTIDDNGWSYDEELTTNTPRYYSVVHDDQIRQLQVSKETLEAKLTYSFNGSLWSWDIRSQGHDSANMLWSSQRGSIWQPETAQLPSTKLLEGHIALYDNKVWLLGAFSTDTAQSCSKYTDLSYEIWSSDNGKDWTYVSDIPEGTPADYAFLSYDDQLWLVGNKVFKSNNGVDWQSIDDPKVQPTPEVGGTVEELMVNTAKTTDLSLPEDPYYPAVFIHQGKLWSKHYHQGQLPTLVSSLDGKNWQMEHGPALLQQSQKLDAVELDGKVLLFSFTTQDNLISARQEDRSSRCFVDPMLANGDIAGTSRKLEAVMVDGDILEISEYTEGVPTVSHSAFLESDWAFINHNHQLYAVDSTGQSLARDFATPWEKHAVALQSSGNLYIDWINQTSDLNITTADHIATVSDGNRQLLFANHHDAETGSHIAIYQYQEQQWQKLPLATPITPEGSSIQTAFFNEHWWLFVPAADDQTTVFISEDASTWQVLTLLDIEAASVEAFDDKLWLTTRIRDQERSQLMTSIDGKSWQTMNAPSPWFSNTGAEAQDSELPLVLKLMQSDNQLWLSASECLLDIIEHCEERTYLLSEAGNNWVPLEGTIAADYAFDKALFNSQGWRYSPASHQEWLTESMTIISLP